MLSIIARVSLKAFVFACVFLVITMLIVGFNKQFVMISVASLIGFKILLSIAVASNLILSVKRPEEVRKTFREVI